MNGHDKSPDAPDNPVIHAAAEGGPADDDGLLSLRTAAIVGGAAAEVWLECTHPAIGNAVAAGVAVAVFLHRLLRRR